jgi:hypothetical protein
MASGNNEEFVHRFNADGTIDSICRQCFVTVATARRESELLSQENDHICEPDVLDRFRHWKSLHEFPDSPYVN